MLFRSAKTSFFFSANYSKQQGVIISNYNKTFRVRTNIEHEVNNFLKFGNNLSVSRQDDGDQNNGSNALSGAIASALRLLPNVNPYNVNGPSGFNISFPAANAIPVGPNSQGVDDNFTNVAFTLTQNKFTSDKIRIINNSFAELSFTKRFKFRSVMSADWFNDYSFSSYDPRHGDGYSSGGIAYNANQNLLRTVWQNYFNYNFKSKGHTEIGRAHV